MILAILSGLPFVACTDTGSPEMFENHRYTISGVTVDASHRFTGTRGETISFPLANAVDGDRNTIWIPRGEAVVTWAVEREKLCGADLAFVFSPPVYIKEISIASGPPANVKGPTDVRRPKNIWVHAYPDGNLLFETLFGDGFAFELADHSGFQSIPFDKGAYASMLRIGAVTVSVMDCHRAGADIPVAIGEIRFIFAGAPALKPRMTLSAIRKKIKTDSRFITTTDGWYIRSGLANPDPIVSDILSNLISLSMSGDRGAEKLFYTYSPPGAYSSEYQSHLLSWYERSKSVKTTGGRHRMQ